MLSGTLQGRRFRVFWCLGMGGSWLRLINPEGAERCGLIRGGAPLHRSHLFFFFFSVCSGARIPGSRPSRKKSMAQEEEGLSGLCMWLFFFFFPGGFELWLFRVPGISKNFFLLANPPPPPKKALAPLTPACLPAFPSAAFRGGGGGSQIAKIRPGRHK